MRPGFPVASRENKAISFWIKSAPLTNSAYKSALGGLINLLHMRQLVELLWSHLLLEVEPYRVEYAGEW
jgi:hypothetical protein